MTRTFAYTEGERKAKLLAIAIYGPSGGGKTYSALRLATGIQRVFPGPIAMLDTEADRGSVYVRDQTNPKGFVFRHYSMGPPFSPVDYLEACQKIFEDGCQTLIIDSLSHEHDGEGGVLDWHAAEEERLRPTMRDAASFAAWNAPKQARKRLCSLLFYQCPVHVIACFRAEEKTAMVKDTDGRTKVLKTGWVPITDRKTVIYEFPIQALLRPMSDGKPDWRSNDPADELLVRLPDYHRNVLRPGIQLTEDVGEALAMWAKGSPTKSVDSAVTNWLALYSAATDTEQLRSIGNRVKEQASRLSRTQLDQLRQAATEAKTRVTTPANPEDDGR